MDDDPLPSDGPFNQQESLKLSKKLQMLANEPEIALPEMKKQVSKGAVSSIS